MQVLPFTLTRQYEGIKEEINSAIQEVLDSGFFVLRDKVKKFEKEFTEFNNSKKGYGVGTGTDALQLALRAVGVKERDEVITVSNVSVPTATAIVQANAKPVFVDVDKNYNIDVSKIEEKINEKTKAIVPIHLFGQPVNIKEVLEIAEKHSLKVIEDCAQAHGAKYEGKKVGNFGDLGCFSFYPTKNLGAYGDGGFVVSNNEEYAEQIHMLRDYGEVSKYENKILGINSRLDEIQAAILSVKLKHLDDWTKKRQNIAKIYDDLLKDVVKIPSKVGDHVYHLYVVRTEKRDELKEYLQKNEVFTQIHYPKPVHMQDSFKFLNTETLPNTEKFSKEILSLPMYPELSEEEAKVVCDRINEFLK
jgi:dTDP-4-amino-4,6-dideoxygalactose transaminase